MASSQIVHTRGGSSSTLSTAALDDTEQTPATPDWRNAAGARVRVLTMRNILIYVTLTVAVRRVAGWRNLCGAAASIFNSVVGIDCAFSYELSSESFMFGVWCGSATTRAR
jgi:hypothetical protein